MKHFFAAAVGLSLLGQSGMAAVLTGTPIASYPAKASEAFDGRGETWYSDPNHQYDDTQLSRDENGGNEAYAFDAQGETFSWVGIDLGANHVITEISFTPAPGHASDMVLGLFMGSTTADFLDSLPLYMIKSTPTEGRNTVAIDHTLGVRYIRYVGPARSQAQVAELEFSGTPGDGDGSNLYQPTNLATVVINTVGGKMTYDKESEQPGTMFMTINAHQLEDQATGGFRERGNYSRIFPKRPWRIKYDKSRRPFKDCPAKAKKWTLINRYGDKSLMRTRLAFDISQLTGLAYTPYQRFVDVIVNGDYRGNYDFCDQVDVRPGRVDITEMLTAPETDKVTGIVTPADTEGLNLTGGYFWEIDAYNESEPVGAWFNTDNYKIPVTLKSPDEERTQEQFDYLKTHLNYLADLVADNKMDVFGEVFDVESLFADLMVQELAGNPDLMWSMYMYKDRDPAEGVKAKTYCGPVWDFDLAFGNDLYTAPIYDKAGFLWEETPSEKDGSGFRDWVRRIWTDPTNNAVLKALWEKWRNNGLTPEALNAKIDEYVALLQESQKLNFMRWPILNLKVHRNPSAAGSWKGEVDAIRNYLQRQFINLDKKLGYDYTLPSVNQGDAPLGETLWTGNAWQGDWDWNSKIDIAADRLAGATVGSRLVVHFEVGADHDYGTLVMADCNGNGNDMSEMMNSRANPAGGSDWSYQRGYRWVVYTMDGTDLQRLQQHGLRVKGQWITVKRIDLIADPDEGYVDTTTIWSGTHDFGDWENSFDVPKERFYQMTADEEFSISFNVPGTSFNWGHVRFIEPGSEVRAASSRAATEHGNELETQLPYTNQQYACMDPGSHQITFRFNESDIPTLTSKGLTVVGQHATAYSIQRKGGVPSLPTGMLNTVTGEDTAPARHYTLQGIEVANPESGTIYIRVQGGKAMKVIY